MKVINEKVQCLKPVFDYGTKKPCKKPVSNNCKVNNCGSGNCGCTYNTNINIFNFEYCRPKKNLFSVMDKRNNYSVPTCIIWRPIIYF